MFFFFLLFCWILMCVFIILKLLFADMDKNTLIDTMTYTPLSKLRSLEHDNIYYYDITNQLRHVYKALLGLYQIQIIPSQNDQKITLEGSGTRYSLKIHGPEAFQVTQSFVSSHIEENTYVINGPTYTCTQWTCGKLCGDLLSSCVLTEYMLTSDIPFTFTIIEPSLERHVEETKWTLF